MLTSKIYKKFIKITVVPLIINIILLFPGGSLGNDTEIYDPGASMRPMVLIIIDNSGSMNNPMPYDSTKTYTGKLDPTKVYKFSCKTSKFGMCQPNTETYTEYTGTFTDNQNGDTNPTSTGQDGIHDDDNNIKLGNRINYLNDTTKSSKLKVAQDVLCDVVDLLFNFVDFGFMKLGGQSLLNGGVVISYINQTNQQEMKNKIRAVNADTATPMAEALTEAGMYFENTSSHPSPWESDNWCQRGFVIIISDGEPTCDTSTDILSHFLQRPMEGEHRANRPIPNSIPATEDIGKYWDQDDDYKRYDYYIDATFNDQRNNDVWVKDNVLDYQLKVPQTFLDDVAHYLYHHDLRENLQGTQNLTTYTIGYMHSSTLLQKTAENGGGLYFTASDYDGLMKAILKALDDIAKKLQTYTAPVVPVTRTSSGDKMYLAFFKPMKFTKFWQGDVQKYGLSDTNQIVDSTIGPDGKPKLATDSSGAMLDSAVPYWSAAKVLRARTSTRNIYTYLGNTPLLANPNNSFCVDNAALTPAWLKLDTASDPEIAKNNLIKYLHGYDAYLQEGTDPAAKREHILGDILHSVPLVVDYATTSATNPNRYIYFGSNDGMIHCLDDTNGEEVWAFIPPDVLPRLKAFQEAGDTHSLFCDGSIRLYQERNADGSIKKAILIFGERGGGNCYYAIDVTDVNNPKYLWQIVGGAGNFSELGQSWSEPVVAKVRMKNISGTETDYDAVIFGGGFDPAQADTTSVYGASIGRGVYIVSLESGQVLKSFTAAPTSPTNINIAGMLYSIPSSVLLVDKSNDNLVDRIYVGDLGGNVWRIGAADGKDNLIDKWIVRKFFASNLYTDGRTDATGRKIYYPPDIAFENLYDVVLFGTGDRDYPRATTTVDRVYGVKDFNQLTGFTTLTESSSGMQDQTGIPSTSATVPALGWYLRLTNSGEKMLATPVLFNKYLLATTFTPNNDKCSIGGIARLYAVNYLIGTYAYFTVGVGIPTEVVLVVRSHGATAFVGAGGGVKNVRDLAPDASSPTPTTMDEVFDLPSGIIPISWREVF